MFSWTPTSQVQKPGLRDRSVAVLPRRSICLPGRDQNLKLVNHRESLLDMFACARRVVLSHRYSPCQIQGERMHMWIGGRPRGLKKTVSRSACVLRVRSAVPSCLRIAENVGFLFAA